MRTKIQCCIDCKKRHTGCHAQCEDYQRESKELDELRKAVQMKRLSTAIYSNYAADSSLRTAKRKKGGKA